jgi:DNA-binding transcriptional LysR family regulator
MEIAWLEAFIAVTEELHFSRAAKRCHVSQPAVSKQIRQLEERLGVVLFERTRRSVRLTGPGSALVSVARQSLDAVQRMQRLANDLSAGESGQLRIGFTPTAPSEVLPELVRRFRRRHPKVSVELVEMSSQEQRQALSNGQLDVALVRQASVYGAHSPRSRQVGDGELTFLPLVEERLIVAVSRDAPLAKARTVSLDALRDQSWVLVRREASPTVYDAIIAACLRSGFSPFVAHTGLQLHSVLAMVASGLGVSMVPESAKRWRTKGVTFLPAKDHVTSRVSLSIPALGATPAAVWFAEVAADWSKAASVGA